MKILGFAAIAFWLVFSSCEPKANNEVGNSSDGSGMLVKDNDYTKALDSTNLTSIQWLDSLVNFGTINEGQKVEVAWKFKNTGPKPLIIISVQPGCGCTVAEQPKEPIAPGKEGIIKGLFDSQGKPGQVTKTMFVQANTTGTTQHQLAFEGQVIPAKNN